MRNKLTELLAIGLIVWCVMVLAASALIVTAALIRGVMWALGVA